MKKTIIFIISIVIIICVIATSKFYELRDSKLQIDEFNLKYEKYLDKEITGREVTTIINQAIDDNEKNYIQKDKNGKYIQDDEKSIDIEIKITEFKEEQIYEMETLYNGGTDEFVKYYGEINFKCTHIEYNSKGRVKYMLFEQILS